ncbi:hypothetical protein HYX19_04630, partial [Candidatus Woesearchaeota archaeon]|nr:hypothetical protein [Candidatus Woesearchaeota archaeon]
MKYGFLFTFFIIFLVSTIASLIAVENLQTTAQTGTQRMTSGTFAETGTTQEEIARTMSRAIRQGLSFSMNLNKQDSTSNPAQYLAGERLEWNYKLRNDGSSFNTNVCFFLETSDRRRYDITNRPILERANKQYCENEDGTPRSPLPSYCPIVLNNILIGNTNNQEIVGNVFSYIFTGSDIPYGDYRLIAQLRNPNTQCSNPDGSIIPVTPIAEYVNYLRYSAGAVQIPMTSFGRIGYILVVQNLNDASQEIVQRLTRVKDFFPSTFQEATNRLATVDTSGPVYIMQVTENMKVRDNNGNIIALDFPK